MSANPENESFDSVEATVTDSQDDSSAVSEVDNSGELESFDNMVPKTLETKKDGNVELLDNQEDKVKVEEEKKSEPKPEEAKKVESEGKSEAPKEAAPEYKPTGKVFKAKDGEHEVKIAANAVIPIKVDGKVKEFTIQELANLKSGEISYESKFNALKAKEEDFQQQNEYFKGQVDNIKGMLNSVLSKIDSEDPLEAYFHLLDLAGKNTVQYKKKVLESNFETFEKMLDMDEVERKLYWTEQEKDFLVKRQEAMSQKQYEEDTSKQWFSKVDALRQEYGVDEVKYVEGYKELAHLGYTEKEITPKAIVEYVTLKPHLDAVEQLISPYEHLIDDSAIDELVSDYSYKLRAGKIALADIKSVLDRTFGETQAVKDVNVRTTNVPKPKQEYQPSDSLESFDDIAY